MLTQHSAIINRLRSFSSILALLFLGPGLAAQTLVTQPLTTTPAAGEYYSYGSIVLSPGFSFTASAGQCLHLYIASIDCQPLTTNPSQGQNYIMTSIPRNAGYNPATSGYSSCDLMQSIQYMDGLGRPSQTVQVKGSPNNMDIVQPISYDQYGRVTSKYLPYAATSSDGSYKADALQSGAGLLNFYNPTGTNASVTQLPGGIPHINSPFANTSFEQSPLNRAIEQGAPGDAWQLSNSGITGSGHTVKLSYGTNSQNEVILWTANASGAGATGNSYYAPGQLYSIITTDENGNNSIEYKDKEGQVVCKKSQSVTNPVTYIATYYIYDNLNNLIYVVPPIPSNIYPSSFVETDAVFLNYIYGYHYDQRKRLVEKQVPGKKWEYLVYNTLDKVVASQDGNQRAAQQWTFIKYDALSRVVWTGTWNNGGTAIGRVGLQTIISGLTGPLWVTRPVGGVPTNEAWPKSGFSGGLTINYYDDYSFPDSQYATPASASTHTTGLLTCTKTYVLGSSAVLYTQYYYDDLGRNITTLKGHYLGGTTGVSNAGNYDEITNSYNFNNDVTSTVMHHYTIASTSMAAVTVTTSYTYDHMGRKKQTFHSITAGNNTSTNPILLSQMDYNEVGQLTTKHLHSETGAAPFLQDVNYTYNERGWLSGAGNSSNLFSFNLQYNNPGTGVSPMFNGNISSMQYTGSTSGAKTFNYSYDPLNRLTAAVSTGNLLNEQIGYDGLGNITSLVRSGGSASALSYTNADASGNPANQLRTVTNNGNPFRSYDYDDNGNAKSDGGIKSITYNMLNLPQTVTQNNTTLASYIYDGTGNKLRNIGSDGNWDYIDGIVYNNNAIQFIQTEEGRAIPNGSSYHYEYNLQDHLGNVRVSFDKNPSSGVAREIQEDEYYSFGLKNPGGYNLSNNNRYLYNGKELQTDLSNQYDYGARFYDPVIGRWNVVDPLAEKSRRFSPYVYGNNNPIRFIDPDGMEGKDWYKPTSGANYVQWFAGNSTHEGFDDIGEKAKIETKGVENSSVSLNSDGTATNDQTGNSVTSSISGQTSIITKDPDASSIDPSTIGQNLGGGTFAGGDNPRTFGGKETFNYSPDKPFDPPAIGHDRRFDNLNASGLFGLLTDTRTIGADWLFVKQEIDVSTRYDISGIDKAKAYFIGTGLGGLSLSKTMYKLNTPLGLSTILMWFDISNKGVTNIPSK
ncbi:DUF6443 domain-containing protein [Pedobacter sp. L105]|uniref:DUF6443 domain-containing protein n=1 Tax=Pedobacter sp. L105 TaxID=1641871 RepID=UPI0020B15400|nr:DUF6443 domain-containing protein [Pedobacter sp. L105]